METQDNFEEEQRRYAQMMPDYSVDDPYSLRVGFGRRLGAYLIDILIAMIIIAIGYTLTGAFGEMFGQNYQELMGDPDAMAEYQAALLAKTLPVQIITILLIGAFEIFMAASPGKLALNMRIGNANRTKATLGTLFFRFTLKYGTIYFSILYWITSVNIWNWVGTFFGIIILIGCFFVLGEKRQALHDMIAKTAVYLSENVTRASQSELIREDSTRGEKNIG